jgi:hypothetical protein
MAPMGKKTRETHRREAGCAKLSLGARVWRAAAPVLTVMPLHCPEIEHAPPEPCADAACSVSLVPPAAIPGTHRLVLQWSAEGPLTQVEVLVAASDADEFAPVAAVSEASTAVVDRGPAWLLDWPTALVKLRACTGSGRCVESNEQPLAGALVGSVAEVLPVPGSTGLFSVNLVLSADGSTLAVASTNEQLAGSAAYGAAVYVFQRAGDGSWQRELRADLERYDTGSLRMSADGNTVAAAALEDTTICTGIQRTRSTCTPSSFEPLPGAVHVFARGAGHEWQQQAFIKSEEPIGDLYDGTFGVNVVLGSEGRWLSVGSERLLGDRYDRQADIYLRGADGAWRHETHLTSADLGITGPTSDPPGTLRSVFAPVAVSGDGQRFASRVAGEIFTPEQDEPFLFDAIRVFRQSGSGWQLEAELASPRGARGAYSGDEGDGFGSSPAFDFEGRTLAIGAPLDQQDALGAPGGLGAYGAGGVYVYARTADGQWQREALLKPALVSARDEFGALVNLSADGRVLLANAHGRAARAPGIYRAFTEGNVTPIDDLDYWGVAAYLFERADATWTHRAAVLPPARGLVTYVFGAMALSADGSTVAINSIPYGDGAARSTSVFVY